MANFPYYIGVDHRETDATLVCEQTARSFGDATLSIHKLEHLELRRRQMFDRPWRIAEDGIYWDERDGKPFSTQFAHTRFLTPLVALADGYRDWALFTDADWMWMANPAKILAEADPSKTVMVVPHQYAPGAGRKMDGQPQTSYNRKLWSALMLWNLGSSKLPTYEMVNQADGGYLHRFGWLKDEDIGYLSETWHWLPNISPTTPKALADLDKDNKHTPINAVHFTLGVPEASMTDRQPTPFDQMWKNERTEAYRNAY
jgi:hypothetical protein